MSSIHNAINAFPSRLLAVGRLGMDQVINAINYIAKDCIANTLEAFPKSHPRAMDLIEPSLVALFKLSNNFPILPSMLFSMVILTMCTAELVFIMCICVFFVPQSLAGVAVGVGLLLMLFTTFLPTILSEMVHEELTKRYLNKTDDITKLGAAYFNIDSESVSKLNAWATQQRIAGNSNWHGIREKLVRFFLRPGDSLDLCSTQLNSLPNIFDAPVFRNIEYLKLSDNQLTDLPLSIIHLQSLLYLDLSKNSTLQRLPEVIYGLPLRCWVFGNSCNLSEADIKFLDDRWWKSYLSRSGV